MKTLHLRIKDKHAPLLNAMAKEVNFVWNFCNELSQTYLQRTNKFLSGFDLQKYTKGATNEKEDGLSISAASVQMIGHEYATRRLQFKKAKLRWRKSYGSGKSLGWIPFSQSNITLRNGQICYRGHFFGLWDSYGLSNYSLRSGNFSQDARGRWYINICIETAAEPAKSTGTTSIGIDLGLKTFATMSDGTKIESKKYYRNAEAKLAVAQRARKKSRARAIHAQIANRRKNFLQKHSTALVRQHGAIFVGDVNATGLAKTMMAKSVFDAGWSTFRTMLRYKSIAAGVFFKEVNEAYSTQTCSCCAARPDSRPKGIAGLGIRDWTCTECGAQHDRDVNAAKNILQRGHALLAAGSSAP